VGGWAVAAIALPYLFHNVTTPGNGEFPVRFGAMAAPALLLGLAGLVAVLPARVRLLSAIGWLVVAGAQWQAELNAPPRQDWRGLLSTIAAAARPDDAILAFPAFHAGAAATYYP